MTLRVILEAFLASLAGTILLANIAIALDRGRRKLLSTDVLEPSRATKVVSVVVFILPFAVALATLFFPAAPPLVTALFATLSLPGAMMVVSSRRFRIRMTPSGLLVRNRFRGEFEVSWANISSVRWGMFRQAFVLRTEFKHTILVEATLRGLPVFAQRLLANVPKTRIAPDAKKLLANAARGVLPELKYYA